MKTKKEVSEIIPIEVLPARKPYKKRTKKTIRRKKSEIEKDKIRKIKLIKKKKVKKIKKVKPIKKQKIKKLQKEVKVNFAKIIPIDIEYEIWHVVDDWWKIYVKDKNFALALSKYLRTSIGSEYMDKKMRQYAWDISFDKKDLKAVQRICKENLK